MAMARAYSRVTHQPAALIYSASGTLSILVLAPPLGVFVGYHLPRTVADVMADCKWPALDAQDKAQDRASPDPTMS